MVKPCCQQNQNKIVGTLWTLDNISLTITHVIITPKKIQWISEHSMYVRTGYFQT